MRNFLKKDIAKILIALFLITTGVVILNVVPGTEKFSLAVNDGVGSLSAVLGKVTGTVNKTVEHKKTAKEYESEIEALKKENNKLKTIVIDYYDVKRENAQYLKFYDFKKENKGLKFKPSKVISRNLDDMFYGFTLDKGKNDGISVNSPVISENGMIGRVDEVFANKCTVKTVLSPDFKAGVVDSKTGDNGVLVGNAKLADQNLSGMMYLSMQNSIQPDDIIVTSGLGGIYPKNLPIGKVKKLNYDDFDSSVYAEIEPYNDIKNIVDVFIVTEFSGKNPEEVTSK